MTYPVPVLLLKEGACWELDEGKTILENGHEQTDGPHSRGLV